MSGRTITEEEFNNLPTGPRVITEEEFNLLPEEEGLGVGYGEDFLIGAVGGAATNIIGKPALHLLGKVPGAKKAVKAIEDTVDDAVSYVGDKLPAWLSGIEKPTVKSIDIKNSKAPNGITTPYPNEALRTTVDYRNKVLKNGPTVDGVEHIDPRWYDEFQDTKSVRLGGGKEDDLLTRSMLSRLSPVNKTKDDLLLDIKRIEEAQKVMKNKSTFPWRKNSTVEPDGTVGPIIKSKNLSSISDTRSTILDEELAGLYAKANNAGGTLGNAVKTIPAAAITGGMFGPAAGGTALLLPYGAKMAEQLLKTQARDNYVKSLFTKAGITDNISPYLERPISRAIAPSVRRGAVGGVVGGTVNVGNSILFPDGSSIDEDGNITSEGN